MYYLGDNVKKISNKFCGDLVKIDFMYDSYIEEYFFSDISLRSFKLIIKKDGPSTITPLSDKDYISYKEEFDSNWDQIRDIDIGKKEKEEIFDAFKKHFSNIIYDEDISLTESNFYISLLNSQGECFYYKIPSFKDDGDLLKLLSERLQIEELKEII